MPNSNPIRIGTRKSQLALWQAEHVQDRLRDLGFESVLVPIVTRGDKILDKPLQEVGGKGLFLKEIEEALLSHDIDLAVHSMKDVPFLLPEGLEISAILERAHNGDAFVSGSEKTIAELPSGARVGTSSLRRMIQLREKYSHLEFLPLRGNVNTRLKKLKDGEFDGIILAVSGLRRLGFDSEITETLDIVSAVGQGAIGIEVRQDDADMKVISQKLNHQETADCVLLERDFLKRVEGDCQIPVGCHVTKSNDQYSCKAFLANVDGSQVQIEKIDGSKESLLSFFEEKFVAAN